MDHVQQFHYIPFATKQRQQHTCDLKCNNWIGRMHSQRAGHFNLIQLPVMAPHIILERLIAAVTDASRSTVSQEQSMSGALFKSWVYEYLD